MRVPGKATWIRFETDAGFFFDFFLAEKFGRTVAELRAGMSAEEWMQWGVYYARKAQQQELAAGR